jgi:hypothetical protein
MTIDLDRWADDGGAVPPEHVHPQAQISFALEATEGRIWHVSCVQCKLSEDLRAIRAAVALMRDHDDGRLAVRLLGWEGP